MGYYVNISDSDFVIPAENIDAAYAAVCELNNHNHLKQGGRYPRTVEEIDGGPCEEFCFRWLPWNYPETLPTLEDVLGELGFETLMTKDGLSLDYYDSKSGQEELFLDALAPYAAEGSYINWVGSDGAMWRHEVSDGQLLTKNGVVVWQ